MNQLKSLASLDLSEEQPVAVWIITGTLGFHTGFAFLDRGAVIRTLHLAWHHKLRCTPVPAGWRGGWVPVGLASLSRKILNARLRYIANHQPEIGYGTDWLCAQGAFDLAGNYSPPPGSSGLTCATFVSEVIAANGLAAVDSSSWPVGTEENRQWLALVVQALEQNLPASPAKDAHIDLIKAHPDIARLKPQEIISAAGQDAKAWPLPYEVVQPHAGEVEVEIQKM